MRGRFSPYFWISLLLTEIDQQRLAYRHADDDSHRDLQKAIERHHRGKYFLERKRIEEKPHQAEHHRAVAQRGNSSAQADRSCFVFNELLQADKQPCGDHTEQDARHDAQNQRLHRRSTDKGGKR